MTDEKTEEIRSIFHLCREATKQFVDVLFNFSESLFSVLISTIHQKTKAQNVISTKRIIDKKELAEFLGVSQRLISDLQNEGMPIVQLGRCVRFDVEEVLAWAKDKKRIQKSKFRVVG